MPKALAGARVQGYDAIGEEILAAMPHAVEVRLGSAGGDVGDAALLVQRHPESNKQSPEMGTQFMILLCLLTMRRFC
jgi:hypothetical protein